MGRLRAEVSRASSITHELIEAYALPDRVSVLRLGRVVGEIPPERLKAMTEKQVTDTVIEMMFGTAEAHARDAEILAGRGRTAHQERAVDPQRRRRACNSASVSTEAERGACRLRNVGLDLWPGEVLGIAGVDGDGPKHRAEVLAGQRRAGSGLIAIAGDDVPPPTACRSAAGMACAMWPTSGWARARWGLLGRHQSGAEGDRCCALQEARPQRLGPDRRPRPRPDQAQRHSDTFGENARSGASPAAISRRSCWPAS